MLTSLEEVLDTMDQMSLLTGHDKIDSMLSNASRQILEVVRSSISYADNLGSDASSSEVTWCYKHGFGSSRLVQLPSKSMFSSA